jgi:hypothetical protein
LLHGHERSNTSLPFMNKLVFWTKDRKVTPLTEIIKEFSGLLFCQPLQSTDKYNKISVN